MWRYEQSTGKLFLRRAGDRFDFVTTGYAGSPRGFNDPKMDHVRSVGPLPKGRYRIRQAGHPRFAPPSFQLEPSKGTKLHGRSGFWIHGDNGRGDNSASTGCIILGLTDRQYMVRQLKQFGATLEVVA